MNGKIFTRRRSKHTNPLRFDFASHKFPSARLYCLALILAVPIACGDQVSTSERNSAAAGLSAVMVAIQFGLDSTDRVRLADSAARANGYDDWADLRAEIDRLSLFPDEFRQVLDTAQKRLDSLAALGRDTLALPDTTLHLDTSLRRSTDTPNIGLTIPGLPDFDSLARKNMRRIKPRTAR